MTSDNASNNQTMMKEFARLITKHTGMPFDWQDRWIRCVHASNYVLEFSYSVHFRCLAHVINLATQAMINSFSSAKYYDPYDPDAHIPKDRDELGLIRATAVKVSNRRFSGHYVIEVSQRLGAPASAKSYFSRFNATVGVHHRACSHSICPFVGLQHIIYSKPDWL